MLKFKTLAVIIAKIIEEDKWINTDEVAEYPGVKATTICEWIKKSNGMPAHRGSRQWKFKKKN